MKITHLKDVLTVLVVTITLPMSAVYSAVPDMPVTAQDEYESVTIGDSYTDQTLHIDVSQLNLPEGSLTSGTRLVDLFLSTDSDGIPYEALMDLSPEELSSALQDAVILGEEDKFWDRSKTMISLLLATSLLVALLLMFSGGGGGGGGGGSGSGGGGDGGDLNLPLGGGPFGGGGGGGDGDGDGGDGGDGDGNRFGGDDVPSNPEPSTLLLTALGLMLPFFRRKSS